MVDKNISVKELAEKLGTTPQILSNKLYRNTFTYNDYVYICDLLGCDVKTVARDSKTEYINKYEENRRKKG